MLLQKALVAAAFGLPLLVVAARTVVSRKHLFLRNGGALCSKLATGGFGVVYSARLAGQQVVGKVARYGNGDDEQAERMLKAEAEILTKLRGCPDHFVQLLEVTETLSGRPCLLLERLPINLHQFILDLWREETMVAREEVLVPLLRQLAEALQCLHLVYDLVHGDVKPKNVLLDPEKKRLLLCDFGSAGRPVPSAICTVVTNGYSAPWKCEALSLRQSHDVWGFGIVASRCLFGNFTGLLGSLDRQQFETLTETPISAARAFVWFCCCYDDAQSPSMTDVLAHEFLK
jgi:serine/threonine protein kinase